MDEVSATARHAVALSAFGPSPGSRPITVLAAVRKSPHSLVDRLLVSSPPREAFVMTRKRYSIEKLDVVKGEARKAAWTFAGERLSGEEQFYQVTDLNFDARNRWEFVVRIPRARGGRIEVRPRTVPQLRSWAELPDRSLTFSRCTKPPHTGHYYCPVALADVTGERSRIVLRSDERSRLPAWFAAFERRMRSKESVRGTRGTDAEALVILVPAGDHAEMIRVFFATKVWVLKEGFTFEH